MSEVPVCEQLRGGLRRALRAGLLLRGLRHAARGPLGALAHVRCLGRPPWSCAHPRSAGHTQPLLPVHQGCPWKNLKQAHTPTTADELEKRGLCIVFVIV